MFAKFKAKKLYAVQHSKFVQFTVFGTYVTDDKDLIEELKANPRVEFLWEFETDDAQIEVSAADDEKSDDDPEQLKTLRAEYKVKFDKKPDAKRDVATLTAKLNAPADDEKSE